MGREGWEWIYAREGWLVKKKAESVGKLKSVRCGKEYVRLCVRDFFLSVLCRVWINSK